MSRPLFPIPSPTAKDLREHYRQEVRNHYMVNNKFVQQAYVEQVANQSTHRVMRAMIRSNTEAISLKE